MAVPVMPPGPLHIWRACPRWHPQPPWRLSTSWGSTHGTSTPCLCWRWAAPFTAQPHHLSRQQRVYNYRLSRARLVVECAFRILASQWRMYRRVIPIHPTNVDVCVKASCVLHNFMRTDGTCGPAAAGVPGVDLPVEGEDLGLRGIGRVGNNNAAREAIHRRECFSSFFSGEGAVAWQDLVAYSMHKHTKALLRATHIPMKEHVFPNHYIWSKLTFPKEMA